MTVLHDRTDVGAVPCPFGSFDTCTEWVGRRCAVRSGQADFSSGLPLRNPGAFPKKRDRLEVASEYRVAGRGPDWHFRTTIRGGLPEVNGGHPPIACRFWRIARWGVVLIPHAHPA